MKLRFYCDCPPYGDTQYGVFATTKPHGGAAPNGWKRICFDVDMPPDVYKEYDLKAPAEYKGEIEE